MEKSLRTLTDYPPAHFTTIAYIVMLSTINSFIHSEDYTFGGTKDICLLPHSFTRYLRKAHTVHIFYGVIKQKIFDRPGKAVNDGSEGWGRGKERSKAAQLFTPLEFFDRSPFHYSFV